MLNLIKSTLITCGIAIIILFKWLIMIPLGIIGLIWAGKVVLDESAKLNKEREVIDHDTGDD
jgi:hypothetical protein